MDILGQNKNTITEGLYTFFEQNKDRLLQYVHTQKQSQDILLQYVHTWKQNQDRLLQYVHTWKQNQDRLCKTLTYLEQK